MEFNIQGLGRLKIDDEFHLNGLLHRQVARLCALEDLADIDAKLAEAIEQVRCVTHQTAGLHKIALMIDCRNAVTGCEVDDLLALGKEKHVPQDNQSARAPRGEGGEGRV